ncbi:MAG TPA: hypothetical protein DIW43_11005 [Spongiibacteraceae bacterium]|nr:hypothetical protein [Spongiibacteraceae bacterium]HCS27974.1 hypothetical protein [Spongiibacteraceae bacterium]
MRIALIGLMLAATVVLTGCPDSDSGRTVNTGTAGNNGGGTTPGTELAANDLSVATDEDTTANGQLTARAPAQSTLTFTLSQAASNGLATVNDDGRFTYTPVQDFNGSDQFTYDVSNTQGGKSSGTVSITVNPIDDVPVAESASFAVQTNLELTGQLVATDADGDSLSYALDQTVSNGTLTLNSDGSFSYRSNTDYVGADSFNFVANDGNSDSSPATVNINVTAGPVNGVSRDITISSNVDGEDISFTLHEPDVLEPGQSYPLILEGHGYGGSKVNAASRSSGRLYNLLANGYGVLSIDQRGFGESGGTVRLFDPRLEGQDLLQILDWAEDATNIPWLDKSDGDIVLGAIGGSYGGGYQHTIYALDPDKRIDALAPEITWHDLRYSLFSGQVFKTYWATLLSAAGNALGNQDPQVNQGLLEGLLLNELSEENLQLLYEVSLISHCEKANAFSHNGQGVALDPVPALYWQSARDTLFNMNDARDNADCLKALGGDVRLLTKTNGHDAGDGERCGDLDKVQSIRDWFDEKLKGEAGKASYIPNYCFTLGESGTDAVITDDFPTNINGFMVPEQSITAFSHVDQANSILLSTTGSAGAVLAGVPKVTLTVSGLTELVPVDPILFLGIGIRSAGSSSDTLVMGNQVRPMRGFGNHEIELTGVNVRLQPGDEVRLLIYSGDNDRYPNSGSRVPVQVTVAGSAELPLLAADLPAPPSNTD